MWMLNEGGRHSRSAKHVEYEYSNDSLDLWGICGDDREWEVMAKWELTQVSISEVVETAQKWRGVSELSDSRT